MTPLVLEKTNYLQRLNHLYQQGYQDNFLDLALGKIVARQLERDETDLLRIRQVLAQFETEFGLSSSEFWQKFTQGQLADTADFMEWHIFCKMEQRILMRLQILRGE